MAEQENLLKHRQELENIIERLHITRASNGFFELICPTHSIFDFIDEMDKLQIKITGFTWWCYVTKEHEPCGMGGPYNKYGDGWYSEIKMWDFTSFGCNSEYRDFFSNYPKSPDYKSCFVPGFCLETL